MFAAEELGLRPDRARPLDAGERLDPGSRAHHDRTVRGVEDRVRVDSRGLVDPQAVGGADEGQVRRNRRAQAVSRQSHEVALEMRAVLGHQVPGALNPLAAELSSPVLGQHLVEPVVDPVRLQSDRGLGPDHGTGRQAVAQADPGTTGCRSLEAKRGNPAAVDHHHGALRQPLAVVDGQARVALAEHVHQVVPDHAPATAGPRADPEGGGDLLPQAGGAEQELVGRPSQGQRLKSGNCEILDEAQTHGVLRCRSGGEEHERRRAAEGNDR